MSTTIDQKVVEMRFDNKHFESNVQTSLSTLDKLKQKLQLGDASKGLEDVSNAAKRVDMSGLGSGVEAIQAKFSALQVIGITALTNITNQAVNAGKKMISALTIDPIKTGLQEYETQINAVQTILANTQSKGTNIDDVNRALEELNKYADMTIYNFTEMTRNIGTFTAAGVDLDTSTNAIKGIANLAAVSGSTSQQASTAMYQLSQALASGTVKLMDWNSVVNAGMGGQVFQDALKETARVHGVAIDEMIESEGSFRETLKNEWLTADILTETLQKFTLTTEGLTEEQIKANREMLAAKGYTEEQIDEIFKLGNTATEAATKVKTFTQLWDVLKESAQSGWAQTWKLIIGDYEEAKALLSPIADTLTGIIGKMSDWRNAVIESALGKGFADVSKRVKEAFSTVSKTVDSVKGAVEVVADLGDIVNKVIRGDFGNGTDRFNALTKAGLNYYEVQNKVNEKLGDSFRHTQETIDAQNKLLGTQKKTNEVTSESVEIQEDVANEQIKRMATLTEMSDAELEALGYTKEQIKAFKELADISHKLGIPIEELIENIDQIDGRWLLFESIKNIGKSIADVFKIIGSAWTDIMGPMMKTEEIGEHLFNGIAAFHRFTRSLRLVDGETGKLTENGDKLLRTLKGVFVIVKLVSNIFGGAFKIAFNIINALLKHFDLNILDVTAKIGDVLVEFDKWLTQLIDFEKIIAFVAPYVSMAAEAIANFFAKVKDSDSLALLVSRVKETVGAVMDWISGIKDAENIPEYIIQGLVNGLKSGATKAFSAAIDLAKAIWEGFCSFLRIASPSKLMTEGGEYIAQGAALGIQNGSSGIMDVLKNIASKMFDFVKNIDLGSVFAGGSILGGLLIGNKFGNAAENFTAPMEGVGDVLTKFSKKLPKLMNSVSKVVTQFAKVTKSFSKVLNGVANTLNAVAFQIGAKALLNVAFAIAVLVGSIALLALLPQDKVWSAVGVILALGIILGGFILALSKLDIKEGAKLAGFALALIAIAGSLILVGLAVKMMAGMGDEELAKGIIVVVLLAAIVKALMEACDSMRGNEARIAATMLGISFSMLLLLGVIKLASMMDGRSIIKGLIVVIALSGIIAALMAATEMFGKNISKVGATILGISLAMLLLLGVIKLASMMDGESIIKGLFVVAALSGIIVALMTATNLFGKDAGKIGATLLGVATAMIMMALVMKITGSMSPGEILKGVLVVAAFGGIIVGLMAATKLVGSHADKIAKTILTMSLAIGVLALIATLLGFVPIGNLAKGIIAVSLLAGMMTLMIQACRGVRNIMSNLIVMTVAIGVMASAIGILSALDIAGVAVAAGSISLLMGMFALMTKITGSNAVDKKALLPLLAMVGIVAILAAIIYALATLEVEAAITAVASISVLLLVMSGSMALAGAMGGNAILGVVALTLMLPVVYLLAQVLSVVCQIDLASSKDTLIALSAMLIVLSGVLLILGGVGMMTYGAFVGIAALVLLIGAIAEVLKALGQLSEETKSLIDSGLPVLEKIGYAIGSFVGSIIGGFAAGAVSGLPEIGQHLSDFMNNAKDFIDGIKMVDGSVIEGALALGAAMTAIVAADFLADIANLVPNGSSLAEFGLQLSAFMVNVQPFIEGAKSIDATAVEGVKALAGALLALTGANVLDSLTQFFSGGDSSLDSFGRQLPMLGGCISQFAENLGTFDESKVTTIKCAADAIKAMAEAADALPNQGGWLSTIVGENDMETFGTQLPTLAIRLSAFATNLGTFNDDKVNTITCAANAIKVLAEAAGELPNEGGWLGKIVGDNSIETFGSYLPTLGIRLSAFATNLGTFDDNKVATVTCAANAIKAIADVAKDLPNEGGWLAKIVGDNSIETFGGYLPGLGTNLSEFATNLGTFTSDKVSTVTSAVNAIKAFAVLADADLKGAKNNISGFGDNLGTFATDISTFASNLPTGETLNAAVAKVRKILSMLTSLLKVDPSGAANFKSAINDLGNAGVDSFVEAFTSSTAKKAVKTAAKDLMDQVVDGIDDKKKAIETSGKEAAGKAIDGFDSKSGDEKTGAKQAGKDFGSGLVEGIDSKQTAVYNAGYRLGQKAVEGEKDGQKSASPSKLTIQAGKWLGEGLIVGMDKIGGSVYNAGKTLGATSTKGISSAISRISETINSDIDAQPTIRPVLDLSDVKSGASAISGLFGATSVGVAANLGAVNSMMNRRNQNGTNTELASAIDRLRKDLGKTGNTYNSIGGVTVEEGTELSDAIKVIVRAARQERRV